MTAVQALFEAAGLTPVEPVRWKSHVPTSRPGVYVVAVTADAKASLVSSSNKCPVDEASVLELLRVRPEATIDGRPATAAAMCDRLELMWPRGESAVYIGRAGTSLSKRIGQFYRTRLGARGPHAGGWPVKMLADQRNLWVHYSPCADPTLAEQLMVNAFVSGVPTPVSSALIDPAAPLPFANLEFPGGRRKRHGISGVKERRPETALVS